MPDAIMDLISNYGFPIAACCALFWLVLKLTEEHKKEMESMREALENNTLILTRLCEKFDKEK